jgi:hypothetical protein
MLGMVVAGCALLMLIGGIAGKSTRWTDMANGSGMRWTDGVQPWAVWACLGAVAILGLFYLALRNDWWLQYGGFGALLFWRAGVMAADYKTRFESAGWSATYDRQSTALGLHLTPVTAVTGSMCAVLVLASTTWLFLKDRRAIASM